MYIDKVNFHGDISEFLDSFDSLDIYGYVRVFVTPYQFALYEITSITYDGTYEFYTLGVNALDSVGVRPNSGTQVMVGFNPRGQRGFTGSRGFAGSSGEYGYAGSFGYTGSKGDLGYTGSQGDQGTTGFTGSTGAGYTGSEGNGFTGSQGLVGYTGSAGTGGGGGGASVSVGTTPPGSPTAGDLWWNSEEGTMYLYYNDGSTSQWVEASPVTPGPIGLTGSAGYAGSIGDTGFTGSQGSIGKAIAMTIVFGG